jgi:hypothetical protein
VLEDDGAGITLNPDFESAIQDIGNFRVKEDLLLLYPELAPCFDTNL